MPPIACERLMVQRQVDPGSIIGVAVSLTGCEGPTPERKAG